MAFDLAIAAYTVFAEASGEPSEAKLGVAFTLVNRVKVGMAKSLAEACLIRKQFSCWNDDARDNGNLLRACREPDISPTMRECITVVQEAQSGQWPDPTEGALNYHDTGIAPPYWAEAMERTVVLGRLVFYKPVVIKKENVDA